MASSPDESPERDRPSRSSRHPSSRDNSRSPSLRGSPSPSISPVRKDLKEPKEKEEKEEKEENIEALRDEYERLKDMRSGGRYVPPAKLRSLEEKLGLHKSPEDQQRLKWEDLKKNINSLINKVNQGNIKIIVQDVFKLNLIRGRGLFCRSILKAQSLALPFTPVYASLVAIINTKLPIVGELLLTRVILQFKRAFRRNNKQLCLSSVIFIAHLCNHQIAHEIIALEILSLLLQNPTDDSVEIAVAFVRESGAFLNETSKTAMVGVFDRFREVLHDGSIEKRTQYMIEVLFQTRKENFKDHPVIPEDLDLVEEDEQITHMIGLDDQLKAQDTLNVFKFDPNYENNEAKYEEIKHDILGSDDEEQSEADSEDELSEDEGEQKAGGANSEIKDMTNTELTNLRKTIYLNIVSSMSVDEAAHKLFKLQVPEGKENEIVNMIVETCSQEKIYNKTYGAVASRFCYKSRFWRDLFQESFRHYYEIIHRYDTNQIRNIATLFGFILADDGLDWEAFEVVHMNEEESTSSSRIFMKILFEEMKQEMGVKKMVERFQEEYLQPYLVNLFPKNNKKPEDTRFSINYFTAIGLGILTEDMREFLQNMPPPTPPPKSEDSEQSDGERSDYESDDGSITPPRRQIKSPHPPSESESESEDDDRSPGRKPYSRPRSRSYSRSPSRSPRSRSISVSPERSPRPNRRDDSVDSNRRSQARLPGKNRSPSPSSSPERRSRRRRSSTPDSRSPSPEDGNGARRRGYASPQPRNRKYGSSYSKSESRGGDRDVSRKRRRVSETDSESEPDRPSSSRDRRKDYKYRSHEQPSKPKGSRDSKDLNKHKQFPDNESSREQERRSRRRDDSPPPKRPKSWEEVERRSSVKKEESDAPRRRARAAAADYL